MTLTASLRISSTGQSHGAVDGLDAFRGGGGFFSATSNSSVFSARRYVAAENFQELEGRSR